MDIGKLIKDTWNLSWKFKYLWVLGFFVGGGMPSLGSGSNYQFDSDSVGGFPGRARSFSEASSWVQSNLGLIIPMVVLLVVLALVYWVVSFIAEGGLTRAGADIQRGELTGPSDAWAYGLRFAWRYVGMFFLLLLAVLGFIIFVLLAGLLVFGVGALIATWSQVFAIVLGVLIAIVVIPLLLAFAIAVGMVVQYAKRAIAIEDAGVFESLAIGVRLLKSRLGSSLLAWLVQVGLSIASTFLVIVVLIAVGIPLGILGLIAYTAASGVGTVFWVFVAFAAVVVLAVLIVTGSAISTFFWHYWTLVYLELSRTPERVAIAQAQPESTVTSGFEEPAT